VAALAKNSEILLFLRAQVTKASFLIDVLFCDILGVKTLAVDSQAEFANLCANFFEFSRLARGC